LGNAGLGPQRRSRLSLAHTCANRKRTAETECQRTAKLASLELTLADTRGPYTLLVYGENAGTMCVTGPSVQSPAGSAQVVSLGAFGAASVEAERHAAAKRGVSPRNRVEMPAAIDPHAIRTVVTGGQTRPRALNTALTSVVSGRT